MATIRGALYFMFLGPPLTILDPMLFLRLVAGSFRFSLVFKLCARHYLSQATFMLIRCGGQPIRYCLLKNNAVLVATCHGRDTGPRQDHSILQHHGNAVLMAACRGRDTGPRQDHSILASHGGAGLMVEDQGRDTGPQPEHSILPSHGSAGLMAACCGRDIYSIVLRKGDIMCC